MARLRRRLGLLAAAAAAVLALAPRLAFAAQWGSAYGDPAGFCPAQSGLPATYQSLPMTNDPTVGNNPEQDTFFGFYSNPGWDDWYGSWYGDFRGRPADSSGWQLIAHVVYPNHAHWNFSSWGWAVHGHAKQYIAYYNPTFAGQCGMGWGATWPAPYMADVYGVPVADFYVDSVPPPAPRPRVWLLTQGSVSFTWPAVVDVGDGAGADYVVAGLDHYTSWYTVNGGPAQGRRDSPAPITLVAPAAAGDTVCAHVSASDRLGNTSATGSACGSPASRPPVPPPPAPVGIQANPVPGLTGLPGWFWLNPAPATQTTVETINGVVYWVDATPTTADWSFGDGGVLRGADFGSPYPAQSDVQHLYQAQSEIGYTVTASVTYSLSWHWLSGQRWLGPYPMGSESVAATPYLYPVRQAQPQLQTP